MNRDLGQGAREDLARLQLALRTLWPDRPVVYFTEAAGQALGSGPVLTEEEQGQLRRVAEVIRDAENRGAPADRDALLLGRMLLRVIADEERDVFLMLRGDDLVIDGTIEGLTVEEQALVERLGGWRHS